MRDAESISGVLLVDDESEFVDTVQERLMTRGIDAQIAYNGEEALGRAAQSTLDVVVLDLKMPGLNGLQVLEKLRADYPHLQVIMLTGHGSAEERQAAEKIGIFAYLPKPQNIETLAALIRKASLESARISQKGSQIPSRREQHHPGDRSSAKPSDR